MCGCCVSECNSMESDPDFLGPAALAKAQRFVGDQRETTTTRARLQGSQRRARHLGLHALLLLQRALPEGRRSARRDRQARRARRSASARARSSAPRRTCSRPSARSSSRASRTRRSSSTRRTSGGFLNETAARAEDDRPARRGARRPVRPAARARRQGAEPAAQAQGQEQRRGEAPVEAARAQAREHEGLGTNHPSLIDSHD